MDAVIDTQAAGDARPSAEIVNLDEYRQARGLSPVRIPAENMDSFPWAYTFGPPQRS